MPQNFPFEIPTHLLEKARYHAVTERTQALNTHQQNYFGHESSVNFALKNKIDENHFLPTPYICPETGYELDCPLKEKITIETDGGKFHHTKNLQHTPEHTFKRMILREAGWITISIESTANDTNNTMDSKAANCASLLSSDMFCESLNLCQDAIIARQKVQALMQQNQITDNLVQTERNLTNIIDARLPENLIYALIAPERAKTNNPKALHTAIAFAKDEPLLKESIQTLVHQTHDKETNLGNITTKLNALQDKIDTTNKDLIAKQTGMTNTEKSIHKNTIIAKSMADDIQRLEENAHNYNHKEKFHQELSVRKLNLKKASTYLEQCRANLKKLKNNSESQQAELIVLKQKITATTQIGKQLENDLCRNKQILQEDTQRYQARKNNVLSMLIPNNDKACLAEAQSIISAHADTSVYGPSMAGNSMLPSYDNFKSGQRGIKRKESTLTEQPHKRFKVTTYR